MCCCYVNKCCCGCMTTKSGAYAMALIDLFFDCVICMFFGIIIGVYGYNLSTIWLLIIFLLVWANLLLLCGLNGDGCGFMIVSWQVIMFVYIWLLIIGWLFIPFVLIMNNHQLLPKAVEIFSIRINLKAEPSNALQWGIILLGVILLPIYYIYFWIIVNSYRKSINRRRRRNNRLEVAKQHNANIMYNHPFYLSPNYGSEPFDYNAPYPNNLHQELPLPYNQDVSTIAQPLQQNVVYDVQEMSNIHE